MSFKIIITNSYWNSQQVPLNACGLLMTGIVGDAFHDLFAFYLFDETFCYSVYC